MDDKVLGGNAQVAGKPRGMDDMLREMLEDQRREMLGLDAPPEHSPTKEQMDTFRREFYGSCAVSELVSIAERVLDEIRDRIVDGDEISDASFHRVLELSKRTRKITGSAINRITPAAAAAIQKKMESRIAISGMRWYGPQGNSDE